MCLLLHLAQPFLDFLCDFLTLAVFSSVDITTSTLRCWSSDTQSIRSAMLNKNFEKEKWSGNAAWIRYVWSRWAYSTRFRLTVSQWKLTKYAFWCVFSVLAGGEVVQSVSNSRSRLVDNSVSTAKMKLFYKGIRLITTDELDSAIWLAIISRWLVIFDLSAYIHLLWD